METDTKIDVLIPLKNKYAEYEEFIDNWNKEKHEKADRQMTIQSVWLEVCFAGFMAYLNGERWNKLTESK